MDVFILLFLMDKIICKGNILNSSKSQHSLNERTVSQIKSSEMAVTCSQGYSKSPHLPSFLSQTHSISNISSNVYENGEYYKCLL